MNELTKAGLVIGVLMLLLLGYIFKGQPLATSHKQGPALDAQMSTEAVGQAAVDSAQHALQSAMVERDELQTELVRVRQALDAQRTDSATLQASYQTLQAELAVSNVAAQQQGTGVAAIQPVAGLDAARLELEKQDLLVKLQSSDAASREMINSLRGQLRTKEATVMRLRAQVANAKVAVASDGANGQLVEHAAKIQVLESEVAAAERQLAELNQAHMALQSKLRDQVASVASTEQARLETQQNSVKIEHQQLLQQLQAAKSKAADQTTRADALEAEIEPLRDQLTETGKERDSLAQALQSRTQAQADVADAKTQANNERGYLMSQLQDVKLRARAQTQEIESLNGRLNRLVEQRDEAVAARDALQQNTSQLPSQADVLHDLRRSSGSERQYLISQLNGAKSQLRQQAAQISTLQTGGQALQRDQDAAQSTNETPPVRQTDLADQKAAQAVAAEAVAAIANANLSGVDVVVRGNHAVSIQAGSGDVFRSGGTALSGTGRSMLDQVAVVLNTYPQRRVQVEGHTDNVPIGAATAGLYGSNWDLSVARAMSAVRYLERRGGVDTKRLSGAGFGEFAPIASNESRTGRAKNRRIEVVIYNDTGAVK